MTFQETLELVSDQDPIHILQQTPAKLELYLMSFSPGDFERSYAPLKWNVREILAHIADAELVFAYRLRQMLYQKQHAFQAVDQMAWARDYQKLEPSLALDAFRALRMWNLALFTRFGLEDWFKEAEHPDYGMISVDTLINYWAGHDLNHLSQLDAIAKARALN
ncbi:MAG: DinB family protein [Trueperaceae bacterium]|nr:DinB family protein [Trueperaceae bacterium]